MSKLVDKIKKIPVGFKAASIYTMASVFSKGLSKILKDNAGSSKSDNNGSIFPVLTDILRTSSLFSSAIDLTTLLPSLL